MTLKHDANPKANKHGVGRASATKNTGEGLMCRIFSPKGEIHHTVLISSKEVARLQKLKKQLAKLNPSSRKNYRRRTIVDSGASRTFLNKQKWLKNIHRRIQLTVRNATGGKTSTTGKGKVNLRTIDSKGNLVDMGKLGSAFLLPKLTYSLLSVSEMNKQGFTVVFAPEEGYILHPDGTKIPLEKKQGLFFMPTIDADENYRRTHDMDNTTTDDNVEEAATTKDKVVKRTATALKRAAYDPGIARALCLRKDAIIINMQARHVTQRIQKYEDKLHAANKLRKKLRRYSTAAAHNTNGTTSGPTHPLSDRDKRAESRRQRKAKNAPTEPDEHTWSEEEKIEPPENTWKEEEAWTTVKHNGKHTDQQGHAQPKQDPPKGTGSRKKDRDRSPPKKKAKGKDRGKKSESATIATRKAKAVQGAIDHATNLHRRLNMARNLLHNTEVRLKSAIRENVLERSDHLAAAADRELLRVREWHRVHRLLNHASKKDTDAAYLSGKYLPPSGKDPSVYKKLPHQSEKYCSICLRGKFIKRNRRLFQDRLKVRRAGEVWHSDLCGPFPASAKGYKYMCTFTDAATGYMVMRPIANKSGTHKAIKKLHAFVEGAKPEVASGHEIHSIKRLITDRGGEYTSRYGAEFKSSKFNKTCEKLGIKQYFSSAYTSRHNGRAEKTNRTIAEGMRCALIDSGMPWSMWADAAQYATFTANRIDRVGSKGTSAYHRFTGLRSGNENFVAFGQHGQMTIAKPNNLKGKKNKSVKVRMVGYPQNSKGYTVVDDKGKKHTLVHVEFASTRQPVTNGYTEEDDKKVMEAIEPEPLKVDDHTSEPNDLGIVHAREDGDIRRSATRTDDEMIKFQRPIYHNEIEDDAKFDKVKPPKEGSSASMSVKAATDILTKFMKTKGEGLVMEFKQDHQKSGKSGIRYATYKNIRTHAEYVAALKKGTIKGSLKSYKGGDAVNDLHKGLLIIQPAKSATAANVQGKRKRKRKKRISINTMTPNVRDQEVSQA